MILHQALLYWKYCFVNMIHISRASIASIRPFSLNVAIRYDKRRKRSTNGINKLTGINREYVTNREYTSQVVYSNDKNLSICELIALNRYTGIP